jgi:hypothetical protein
LEKTKQIIIGDTASTLKEKFAKKLAEKKEKEKNKTANSKLPLNDDHKVVSNG